MKKIMTALFLSVFLTGTFALKAETYTFGGITSETAEITQEENGQYKIKCSFKPFGNKGRNNSREKLKNEITAKGVCLKAMCRFTNNETVTKTENGESRSCNGQVSGLKLVKGPEKDGEFLIYHFTAEKFIPNKPTDEGK